MGVTRLGHTTRYKYVPELAVGSLSDSSTKKIQVKNGFHPPVVDHPSSIINLIAKCHAYDYICMCT